MLRRKFILLCFAFCYSFVHILSAESNSNPNYASFPANENGTCYKRVPYDDEIAEKISQGLVKTILSADQLKSSDIRGWVTIIDCCDGFARDNETGKCETHCDEGCLGGTCTGPNICTCEDGWFAELGVCKPICKQRCSENAYCFSPDYCTCKFGYEEIEGACRPVCLHDCMNGVCVAPRDCRCDPGYHLNKNKMCEPACGFGCIRAHCTLSRNCTCPTDMMNYPEDFRFCVPQCPSTCINGQCHEANVCTCKEGYMKGENDTCVRDPSVPLPVEEVVEIQSIGQNESSDRNRDRDGTGSYGRHDPYGVTQGYGDTGNTRGTTQSTYGTSLYNRNDENSRTQQFPSRGSIPSHRVDQSSDPYKTSNPYSTQRPNPVVGEPRIGDSQNRPDENHNHQSHQQQGPYSSYPTQRPYPRYREPQTAHHDTQANNPNYPSHSSQGPYTSESYPTQRPTSIHGHSRYGNSRDVPASNQNYQPHQSQGSFDPYATQRPNPTRGESRYDDSRDTSVNNQNYPSSHHSQGPFAPDETQRPTPRYDEPRYVDSRNSPANNQNYPSHHAQGPFAPQQAQRQNSTRGDPRYVDSRDNSANNQNYPSSHRSQDPYNPYSTHRPSTIRGESNYGDSRDTSVNNQNYPTSHHSQGPFAPQSYTTQRPNPTYGQPRIGDSRDVYMSTQNPQSQRPYESRRPQNPQESNSSYKPSTTLDNSYYTHGNNEANRPQGPYSQQGPSQSQNPSVSSDSHPKPGVKNPNNGQNYGTPGTIQNPTYPRIDFTYSINDMVGSNPGELTRPYNPYSATGSDDTNMYSQTPYLTVMVPYNGLEFPSEGFNTGLESASGNNPTCDFYCYNGDCVGRNVCACKAGYAPDPSNSFRNLCVPVCQGGCINGVCSAPNQCICSVGFVKERKGSQLCIPISSY